MWESISSTMWMYFHVYVDLITKAWNRITPMEYAGLLIAVAVIGWLAMKNVSH